MLIDLPEEVYYEFSNALQATEQLQKATTELVTLRLLLRTVIESISDNLELSIENNIIYIDSTPITDVIQSKLHKSNNIRTKNG